MRAPWQSPLAVGRAIAQVLLLIDDWLVELHEQRVGLVQAA
jgi:hypothetical protein